MRPLRAALLLAVALLVGALVSCTLLVPTDGLSAGGVLDSAANDVFADAGPASHSAATRGDAGHGEAAPSLDAETLGAVVTDAQPPDARPTSAPADAAQSVSDAAPDAGCPRGEIVCGGQCVDPTSDPLNCNGCGNVCHDGACGTSIAADMHSPPSSAWVFNGTAKYDGAGPSAAMTVADVLYQAGSVSYRTPIAVDTFTAKFEFRMGYGGGSRNDGMGFLFQKTGPTALSGAGESLGMAGLDGFGVEFDLVNNEACGDVSDDHIAVDSLANCPTASGLPTSLFANDLTGIVDLADAHWHQAVVSLAGGSLTVEVDGATYATAVALPGFVPGTPYYFGFAGATGGIAGGPDGGGGYQTEVRDVSVTFPTPRCL